jgi:hypothetical protein
MYITTKIIGICTLLFAAWMVFEIWRAPLMQENEDGSWTELEPPKTLKSLFKFKNK